MNLRTSIALLCWLLTAPLAAQTPIANRLKAVARQLSAEAHMVARYTDDHRHCLYYTEAQRLYRYDVLTNRKEEVAFASDSYNNILNTWLSPDGNFFFIVVDRGAFVTTYMESGQELWRYDTRTRRPFKVGQGFRVEHRRGCIVIHRATRCLNPDDAPDKQRWMARNHFYDLYGKVIWAKEEYEVGK